MEAVARPVLELLEEGWREWTPADLSGAAPEVLDHLRRAVESGAARCFGAYVNGTRRASAVVTREGSDLVLLELGGDGMGLGLTRLEDGMDEVARILGATRVRCRSEVPAVIAYLSLRWGMPDAAGWYSRPIGEGHRGR